MNEGEVQLVLVILCLLFVGGILLLFVVYEPDCSGRFQQYRDNSVCIASEKD